MLELRLLLPRIGIWVADVIAEGDTALAGTCTITDGSLSWVGTAVRSGTSYGRARARIVGGTGGLGKAIGSKNYSGAPVRVVLEDIVSAASEQLDSASTASVLATTLPYWTRPADTGGVAISSLAQGVGAAWRVQASGKVWFGAESYPKQSFEHDELDQDEVNGCYVIASDRLELRPGVAFDGRKVSRVVHTVGSVEARTKYWIDQ